MDMIVHEAVGPEGDAGFPALFKEDPKIELPILVTKEDRLPAVPPLRDVMRQMGNGHSGKTRHRAPEMN